MKTAVIRKRFLDYFSRHQHQQVASGSLVPGNDPTLLFTNAGMVQFKDLFLGNEQRDYLRAVTSQRCVRAGGKHNDLENVGYTARHHTFFEMLGNFSFGDYFKREAIEFAWAFLTEELKLPKEKLWVTVFEEDQQAEHIWLNEIGVNPAQFARIGEKDNFWAMGDVGPCGPCSEIFYDHGEQYWGGPPGTAEEDGDRFIEIWNLVFMQFDRKADGSLVPLPKPSVDTGMGLERIAAVMQGVNNNYEIDLFEHLIERICQTVGAKDKTHHSVRVIADHIRSCSFLIADGVTPSNEGRGYVLRRIIRRAIRHGYQLGGQTPFFYKLVQALVDEMGAAYPELVEKQSLIEQALEKEERRFAETLEQGLKIFSQKTESIKAGEQVSGELVFLLYDTYGFPVDLTADVARERGLNIDVEGFQVLMQVQRDKARSSNQFAQKMVVELDAPKTEFTGYDKLSDEATVLALLVDGAEVDSVTSGSEALSCSVVLNSTPFYAEGGGQVGDIGQLSGTGVMSITDCQKLDNGAFLHLGKLKEGYLKTGDRVMLSVDQTSRRATAANHSATHLLHAALKQVLGGHVIQKGSLVNAERLRFDFSHDAPVSKEQMQQIEDRVNQQVFDNHVVSAATMPIAEAKAAGAEALFGEKYGEQVRVISMGDVSLELCGGTHVNNTAEIGIFKIVTESGIAAGVRRIEALTRTGALKWINQQQSCLAQTAAQLKSDTASVPMRVSRLQDSVKLLESEKKKLQQMVASGSGNSLQDDVIKLGDIDLLTRTMRNADKHLLRATIDKYKDQYPQGVIVLGAEIEGKGTLMAGVAKSLSQRIQAGKLIKHITALADGRGGGRADMAEGGIADASRLAMCLDAVPEWLESLS